MTDTAAPTLERIADYEIVQLLGVGNQGRTYLATAPARINAGVDQVVVKVLERDADDAEFQRVAEELRVFAAAGSPKLATLYDVGKDTGRLYYAMEYFANGSLSRPGWEMSEQQKVQAVANAARGAHALHEHGMVHREVKPSNIMIGDQGGKLSDPGLAHVRTPGVTVTGSGPIGSVEYMEPAVFYGEKAGRATDIWSFGVTLHQSLTGASVYGELPDADLATLLRHVLATQPQMSPQLGGPYTDIVQRCLAQDRANRYPTAEALAADLEQAAGLSS